MRRTVISLSLAMMLCTTLLAGCGKFVYVGNTEAVTQEQGISEEDIQTEEETEWEDTAEQENTTENEPGEETEPEANMNSGSSDITPVEATLEKPAQAGEWVEIKKRSFQDKKDHTMYFKITGVIRGDEAKKVVDGYNAEGNVVQLSELEKDDLEYCVVTYESYFPADFPEPEWGISNVDVDLSICNPDDSGAIAGYIGLSTVWDISKTPDEFHAGNTFTEGRAVFAMVKGSSEYLFHCSYRDDNNMEVNAYIMGQ